MTDEDIILIQREAILKFCRGDRDLALRVIHEQGGEIREWLEARRGHKISAEELADVIRSSSARSENSRGELK
jgi:hypothetical protein